MCSDPRISVNVGIAAGKRKCLRDQMCSRQGCKVFRAIHAFGGQRWEHLSLPQRDRPRLIAIVPMQVDKSAVSRPTDDWRRNTSILASGAGAGSTNDRWRAAVYRIHTYPIA